MRNPFGDNWKKRYIRALKLALERGHISKYIYDELRKEVKSYK